MMCAHDDPLNNVFLSHILGKGSKILSSPRSRRNELALWKKKGKKNTSVKAVVSAEQIFKGTAKNIFTTANK